jgi:hypothetical protein
MKTNMENSPLDLPSINFLQAFLKRLGFGTRYSDFVSCGKETAVNISFAFVSCSAVNPTTIIDST